MNPINKITSLNNIKNISFKSIEKIKKGAEGEETKTSVQQSVVDPLYYQSITGVKPQLANAKAVEQSRFFKKENYIPHTEKILDGFKDGGSFSQVLDDGSVLNGNREVIVVDRTKDENLKDIIEDFKKEAEKVNTNEDLLSDFALKYVYENFVQDNNQKEIEYEVGKEVLLGEILLNSKPVCRHVALLYKILVDEIGIEADYIRGDFQYGEDRGRHAWNQVHEDGCTSLVDPSHCITTGYPEVYYRQKDGSILTIKYSMPEALKNDFDDE